ncbi:IS66 family transposase [Alteromonas mediterranea]|uniref:IS66 family transposase n=1 Tax=Alteromonas mediterranea TaxID=314275 RepID=UPI001E2A6A0E|nr:IS66 family transposase [Alteromonas mediterranea]
MLTDGYAAYTKTVAQINQQEQQIVHAACWVHMRRGFEKALDSEPHTAQQALDIIATLYRHEKHIRHKQLDLPISMLTGTTQRATRYRLLPVGLSQRQRTDLLPKSPFAKALHYAHERESQLKVFLGNPALPMDTNHLERALRVIPMGRKNYLFCWSELGLNNWAYCKA